MKSRPPELVQCVECSPGHRCAAHKTLRYANGKARTDELKPEPPPPPKPRPKILCPGCGLDPCHGRCPRHVLYGQAIPYIPVEDRISSPLYGRRVPSLPPEHFEPPDPTPRRSSAPPLGDKSGRVFLDAEPMAARVRAWEALERTATRWLALREHAERDGRGTSPAAIGRAEQEMVRAIEATRRLRGGA